jgi:hypothetical protein
MKAENTDLLVKGDISSLQETLVDIEIKRSVVVVQYRNGVYAPVKIVLGFCC